MPEMSFSHVVAVLVLFDTRSNPGDVVADLAMQFGAVVLVDNSLQGHPMTPSLATLDRVTAIRNANKGGLAGGYNAAIKHLESIDLPWTRIMFVDDDSDTSAMADFVLDPLTQQGLDRPGAAAVSPVYRDRATGLRGAYIRLGRFRYKHYPREQGGLVPVAFIINSMSIWNRTALRTLGPFNEWLGVDHVDTDYCLRARNAGLGIYINGNREFAHSIGQRVKFRLFGITLQSGGHGPERRFMIARNTIWLARTYGVQSPSLMILFLSRMVFEAIGIVMAETHKGAKLTALVRGLGKGLTARPPLPRAVDTHV